MSRVGVGAVEEQQIGRDFGIRREYAIRQTDNRVQVELGQQFRLDARRHAIGEQRPVRHDDSARPGLRHGAAAAA